MQAREESGEGGPDEAAPARKRPKPAQPPASSALSFAAGDELEPGGGAAAAKGSRSHSDENNSESNTADADTDEAADAELGSLKEAKESAWAGNTEVLLDYLVRRKGRTEGWRRLRQTELEEGKALEVAGDWPWADKTALEVRAAPPFRARNISTHPHMQADRAPRLAPHLGSARSLFARALIPAPYRFRSGGVHLDERPPPPRVQRGAKPERARPLALGPRSSGPHPRPPFPPPLRRQPRFWVQSWGRCTALVMSPPRH